MDGELVIDAGGRVYTASTECTQRCFRWRVLSAA